MTPADISVIVCTRNRSAYLRKALAAIAAATPPEAEVIVVDSASDTDETRQIALESGVVYVRSEKGLSVARNAGITTSARPLVVFTDDDCLPVEGWIDRLVGHFDNPVTGAVTGRMLDQAADAAQPYRRRVVYTKALEGLDAGHGAVMAFRREMLLRLGGFDDVMGAGQRLAGAEDLDIFVRILRAGSQIVHDRNSVVLHANTRVGDDYVALYRGYGLGLGALLAKWTRIDPALGARIGFRLCGRAATRIARAALRGGSSVHDRAMLGGIAAGFRESRTLPIVGERFVPPWSTAAVPPLVPRPDDAPAAPVADAAPVARGEVQVELMRILDETHIATSLQFEAMHTAAVLVLEAGPLLLPDGTLDSEKLTGLIARGAQRVPEMRQKLVLSPLGITAPARVPDENFDARRHVHFQEEVMPLEDARLHELTGAHRGVLAWDAPLWDMTFTRLEDGRIALGARLHHSGGDAKWAFETLTRLTDGEPEPAPDADDDAARAPRGPRARILIPLYAARAWLREQPSVAAGWREYWRKPIVRRAKRMVGRNIRPFKEIVIARRGLRAVHLPPTAHAFFEVDASQTARRAARLRGSLNDLLVAGALRAVDDDARGVDVLVPVSRRSRGDRAIRNHISMTRVHAEPGATVDELVPAIRAHVVAFATGKDVDPAPVGREIGYATVVPWSQETRWFGGARVEELVVLPAGDPRDEFSTFGAVYAGRLFVTVTTRAELDTAAGARRLRAALTGEQE